MKLFITLILLSILIPSIHAAPVYTYAQSPIHSNVLSTQLRKAEPNQVGSVEFKSSYTIASIWAHTSEYSLDYYQNQSSVAVEWQISPIWKAEIDYRRVTAKDNGLDSFVMGFHDLFGIGQNGRDTVPEDQFSISIPGAGVQIDDFEGETLTSAITYYNEVLILSRGPSSLSAGASLFWNNVRDGMFERKSFEQGAQLNYSYINAQNSVFVTLGAVHRNSDEEVTLENRSLSWAVGYEYRFNKAHSVVIESLNYHGWASNDPDFSEPSNELVLGYRYRFLQRIMFEASMTENMRNMDNSTDIGFTLGLRMSI